MLLQNSLLQGSVWIYMASVKSAEQDHDPLNVLKGDTKPFNDSLFSINTKRKSYSVRNRYRTWIFRPKNREFKPQPVHGAMVARERFELSSAGPKPAMLVHYTTGLPIPGQPFNRCFLIKTFLSSRVLIMIFLVLSIVSTAIGLPILLNSRKSTM